MDVTVVTGCWLSCNFLRIVTGLERFFLMKLKSMEQIRLLNCCSGKNPNEEICYP